MWRFHRGKALNKRGCAPPHRSKGFRAVAAAPPTDLPIQIKYVSGASPRHVHEHELREWSPPADHRALGSHPAAAGSYLETVRRHPSAFSRDSEAVDSLLELRAAALGAEDSDSTQPSRAGPMEGADEGKLGGMQSAAPVKLWLSGPSRDSEVAPVLCSLMYGHAYQSEDDEKAKLEMAPMLALGCKYIVTWSEREA